MGPDALLKSIGKKHRHRTGYDSGTSLLHKATSALAFIRCSDPMPTLATTTSILLEPSKEPTKDSSKDPVDGKNSDSGVGDASGQFSDAEATEFVLRHKETVAEVRTLCSDLQVLGRSEFKQLLRWRMKVKKDLEAAEKARGKEAAAAEVPLTLSLQVLNIVKSECMTEGEHTFC